MTRATQIRLNLEYEGAHVFHGGDIQLDGTIVCPAKYQAGAILADQPTILRQGPPGSGPLFRLRGADMQFSGQFYIYGNGVDPIFEIEGSSAISTGWHKFKDIKFLNCPTGGVFSTLIGRYEFDERTGVTGAFIKDENHADNCVVEDCHFYGKNYTILRLNNQQSMKWTFNRGSVNIISDEDKGDIVGADIVRGGIVKFYDTMLNCPRFTFFKTSGVNPNTNLLIARGFERDVPTTDNAYLTILDDSGTDRGKNNWLEGWEAGKWILKVSGYIPRHARKFDEKYFTTKNPLIDKKRSVIEIDVAGDKPN